ncbi:MAG: hypothetical protein AB7P40_00700 [Chloroflexota bacterium]
MIDLTIGYHDELAAERSERPVTNCQKLSEVPSLDEVWIYKRLDHPFSFGSHLGMASDDVLPSFVGKAYRCAADRADDDYLLVNGTTSLIEREDRAADVLVRVA